MPEILDGWALVLIVFALAQLADVATTIGFLRRGGVELNPVIRFFMERFGGSGWIAAKLVIAAAAAWLILSAGAVWMLWIAAALTAFVAWRNTKVAR